MKVSEIAKLIGGTVQGDGGVEIVSVAALETSSKGEIAFFEGHELPSNISASCIIVAAGREFNIDTTLIAVDRPKLAFARAAAALCPPVEPEPDIHPTAAIGKSAVVANDVFVGAFACIGDNSTIGEGTQLHAGARIGHRVTIGKQCVIHPNVVIEDGCTVGDGVILHAGVVIGADGFGYVRDDDGAYVKFPQIGTVVIENDVEIGANTCIDRGALGETRVGEGTKIDNLVQIGHNVHIGKRCVIAAQTGISGSVVIENDCVIGGQVGFGDHATVKSGAIIGSQAGILPGKIVRPGVWWGTPIQPLDEFKRQNAHLKGIERLKERIKILESKLRIDGTASE